MERLIKSIGLTLFIILQYISTYNIAGKPKFCAVPNEPILVHTISKNDKTLSNIDRAIVTYAPSVYLYDAFTGSEEYFPLTIESLLKVGKPAIVYKKGHRKDPSNPQVIVPSGDVTMKTMADTSKFNGLEKTLDNLYLQVGNNASGWHCIDNGDNPNLQYITQKGTQFNARNGNTIKTPYYAIYSQVGGHDYIQYLFLYGYNGDYKIITGMPGTGVGHHKMDFEHLTLQFKKDSIKKGRPELLRIAFASHGSGETRWLDVDNKDLEWKNGKHIVAYAAYHGHGIYPEAGTYIRICGFGNDYTTKGFEWFPDEIIRLERPESSKFNTATMGWIKFPGDLGPEGVGNIPEKIWVGNAQYEDYGKDYKEDFCAEGALGNKGCTTVKTPSTCYEPQTFQAQFANGTVFDAHHLPTKYIKVEKRTTLTFRKTPSDFVNPQFTNKKARPGPLQKIDVKDLYVDVQEAEIGTDVIVKRNRYTNETRIQFVKPGKVYLKFFDQKYANDDIFETETTEKNVPIVTTVVSVEGI